MAGRMATLQVVAGPPPIRPLMQGLVSTRAPSAQVSLLAAVEEPPLQPSTEEPKPTNSRAHPGYPL